MIGKAHKRNWLSYVILILISVFALFPFYIMLKSSLEPVQRIVSTEFHLFPDNWFYFENYKTVLGKYPLGKWFMNSVIVSGVVVAGNLLFDTLAAYALTRLEFKGRNAVFLIILSTLIIPSEVIVVPLYLLMVQLDWVNTYQALIVPLLISPFGIFLLRQNFMSIPKELDEAAMIDGCSRIGILFRIILPNSFAALGTLAVIKFMWTWGDFMWPSLVINHESMRTLPVGIAMFQTDAATIPWDLIITGSVIAVVPVIVLFLFLQKYFIKGMTDGAVKG
ncbi:ABC-type glycerol-3-phosphate transport system permease component [Paenibacillus sp. DS2015]|uniref:carbohydrate ABC transporter permease n=1 Tax=Paenibacillus sp. DS2015 TaxID=3373917 RepID=UPI003D24F7DA